MNTRKLKILLLANSDSFHTERFNAELRRQGCRVLTASLQRGHIHHFHLKPRGPHSLFHYLIAPVEIRRLIDRFRPDIINPHHASGYGFSAALANIGKRAPIVLNLRGGDILIAPKRSLLHKMKPVLALKAAKCVIGDSQYLVSAAEELSHLASKRVIPWGIERRYLSLHKQSYAFQNPLRIIVPRTQEELYNNVFIVRSLAPLLRQGRVEVTFTNFGSLAEIFRRQTRALTDKGVKFYNKMPRSKFLPFMAEHDVYLSASTIDSSPVSLIEAMALGLLPIAADIPGVREWLSPKSGYLFQQNAHDSLKAVINKLLAEQDPHKEMRKENLERVEQKAVFEENIAEQLAIMEHLARGKRQ